MVHTDTSPMSREEIVAVDETIAKVLLVDELAKIPEFKALLEAASDIPSALMEALGAKIQDFLETLSPAGRGALVSSPQVYIYYGEDARREAAEVSDTLNAISQKVSGYLQESRVLLDYREKLETLVEPLGVPGLVDLFIVRDAVGWGFHRIIYDSGPIEGPFRDGLEAQLLKSLTGLSPAESAQETPELVRSRVKHKVEPLGRHLKRHKLANRIALWVLNVVYGKTIEEIADDLAQIGEERGATDDSPYQWVRKQVQQAGRLLGVKRQGRPRKGGVLRQWKLMPK